MAGEYRTEEVLKQLPADVAAMIRTDRLRIALAGQPMAGVVRRPDLKDRLIEAYAGIPGMDKYAQGLSNGGMVPVVETAGGDRVWAPGELFFKSQERSRRGRRLFPNAQRAADACLASTPCTSYRGGRGCSPI